MPTTQLTPYLNFRGQARDAMAFYESVFGGKLDVTTFADMGGMGVPEAESNLVMHSALTVSESVQVMASDVPSHMEGEFPNGRISLSGRTLIETRDGTRTETALPTDEAVLAAYAGHFGIELDRVPEAVA